MFRFFPSFLFTTLLPSVGRSVGRVTTAIISTEWEVAVSFHKFPFTFQISSIINSRAVERRTSRKCEIRRSILRNRASETKCVCVNLLLSPTFKMAGMALNDPQLILEPVLVKAVTICNDQQRFTDFSAAILCWLSVRCRSAPVTLFLTSAYAFMGTSREKWEFREKPWEDMCTEWLI